MKRLLICLMLLLTAFAPLGPAWAEEEGEEEESGGRMFIKPPVNAKPEKEHHDGITTSVWTLVAEDEADKAKGKARVACYSDDKDSFRLDVTGLRPKSVYTVWFTTSSKAGAERAGVGNEPFSFKTGGGGTVLYQAPLTSCPLARFKWVEIRLHPDGDPKNVDNSIRVLKARMIME